MHEMPEVILNVNDNEAARYVTTRMLRSAGFQVVEAANGMDALRVAQENRPAVVVLDINLPDISGIEVCRRLKADARTAWSMVLQMSATNIALTDRVESLAAGADSFLIEPVEPEELAAVTRALLRLYRSEHELRLALAERDMLLREVNHRVKNSLQLVLSMLSLQGAGLRDAKARELFAKAISRVTAIASVHEQLYQGRDPLTVDMHTYLTGLCGELARAGIDEASDARLSTEVDNLHLPTEQGVSIALIVNELVMNALKHARPAQGPSRIVVRLAHHGADRARLTVRDNGAGPHAADANAERPEPGGDRASARAVAADRPAGLGSQLVRMLARQLHGELSFDHTQEGYATHVTFPLQAVPTWRPPS